jgi:drug/metabolite transporter (DMT)-like permease
MPADLKKHKIRLAVLALIASNTIWGAASPIFKWSLLSIHPFTLGYLRFSVAVILLFPFVYKDLYIHKEDLTKILVAAIGLTINIGFFFLGLSKTTSINAPIIASAAPIFILLLSMAILKEKVKLKTSVGTAIGAIGIITIVLTPLFKTGLDGSVTGNMFLVVSTLGSIMHLMASKELAGKYKALPMIFYTFIVASVVFTPFFCYEVHKYGFLSQLTFQGTTGVIYGALFASIAAYALFHYAIDYLKASEVGVFTYVDPIVAVLIAFPLLGEAPTIDYLIGTLLVFVGIFIAENRIHFHPLHKLK